MELERLKGEKSVADNIMATDRNFTKVKLDVEEIKTQSNEVATDVNNRIKKSGDAIKGVYSHNFVSHVGILSEHRTSITNGIKIKTKIPGNSTSFYALIEIKGYSYDYEIPHLFEHSIGFRTWTPFVGTGVICKIGVSKPEIKLAIEDNFVVIFINFKGLSTCISINAVTTSSSVAALNGWTLADEVLKEGATNIKTLAYL